MKCPKVQNLKILVLNHEYPPIGGGAGTACRNTCIELHKLGVDISVITAAFSGLPTKVVDEGVQVLRAPALRSRVLEASSLEVLSFAFSGLRTAATEIRRARPDVVHAYFGLPSGAIGFALKKMFNIPYLISFRGRDVHGGRELGSSGISGPFRAVSRVVWRQAGALVANSHGLRRIAWKVLPDAAIDVIPNGVDTAIFSDERRLEGQEVRLLFVGRLEPYKGLEHLFSALCILRQSGSPRFRLTVVGDGSLRHRLSADAHRMGIDDVIRFSGAVERPGMPSIYHAADIFILPSLVEGMPNVVLEAMASGLPVVATEIPGSEELVSTETGRLVRPADARALAEALAELITNADLRINLGAAARSAAQNRSWRGVAESYLKLYKRILGVAKPCAVSVGS
jgi:glycogen synthase